MENKTIKKLAHASITKNGIDPTVADYVLHNLSRRELSEYVRVLKLELQKTKVTIKSGTTIPRDMKQMFEKYFDSNTIEFISDPNVGAGFVIQQGDTIYDMSLKGYLTQTVDTLTE